MEWIVLGENKGKIKLVSKSVNTGLLPKGAFLTIDKGETKFILRVDESHQNEPYAPSPMIIDMDLSPLKQDQKCQNIVLAYRVKDISTRSDGLIDYISPQLVARRSNQDEINQAMAVESKGPRVFIATVHASQNQILTDETGMPLYTHLPVDMFYHQMLICGSTGSGKTVAMKYFAQYFVEDVKGAVLAINVKDVDFLKMNKVTQTQSASVKKEWDALGNDPHEIYNFSVYYPANTTIEKSMGVTESICIPITLDVKTIEPESLIGLLQGISDIGAQQLPNIFRHWQNEQKRKSKDHEFTFANFVRYFSQNSTTRIFPILNTRFEESQAPPIHRSTFDNIARSLTVAMDFFDNPGASILNESDILQKGKMSVINVTGISGIQFGSILLRHLLTKIVSAKDRLEYPDVPILIIIDEVHQFYHSDSSREALGYLDTICRTGRSKKIGVIFSSQSPSDIPKDLSSVINTKLFFKGDASNARVHGISISYEEMESLKKGYAAASIHELSQLKILKMPMALAGVFDKEEGKNG
jgi:uncharacterized protein